MPDVLGAKEGDQTELGSMDPPLIETFTLGSGATHSADSAAAVGERGRVLSLPGWSSAGCSEVIGAQRWKSASCDEGDKM